MGIMRGVGFSNQNALDRVIKATREVERMRSDTTGGVPFTTNGTGSYKVTVRITSLAKVDEMYPGIFVYRDLDSPSAGSDWLVHDDDPECYVQGLNRENLNMEDVYEGYVSGVFGQQADLHSGKPYNGHPLVMVSVGDVQTGSGSTTPPTGSGAGPNCLSYRSVCQGGYLYTYRCGPDGTWVYDSSTGIPCGTTTGTYPPPMGPVSLRYVSNVCSGKGFWTYFDDSEGSTKFLTYDMDMIQVNGTGLTLMLPDPTGGWSDVGGADWLWIKNTSATESVQVDPGAARIEGTTGAYTMGPLESIVVVPDGDTGDWWIFQ